MTAPRFFEAVADSGLMLDDHPLEILRGPGDHPMSSVVFDPDSRTAITGDVVFSETHAFTGDHDDFVITFDLQHNSFLKLCACR